MTISLTFRADGPAYERAKAVADAMGLPINRYLLECIKEGHRALQARHAPATDFDEPTFLRWGIDLTEDHR